MKATTRPEHRTARSMADNTNVVIAGYRLLRLSRAQWRATLTGLAAPLARLGDLRRVQSNAWQAAIVEHDCPGQHSSVDCGGELCA